MKKAISVLLALIVLLAMALPVSADIPDLTKTGSLRLYFYWDNKPLNGGKLTLYRVGDIVVDDDWNFSFALIPELADSRLSLDDPNDSELAQKLMALAKARKLPELKVPIKKGVAEAPTLASGLYLVTQNEGETIKGYQPIAPFLISIPRMVAGEYVYEVEANPKVPLETTPSSTTGTTTSTNKKLPQTGQLWWPVPMLLCVGLACVVVGLVRRRRDEDET